MRILVSAVYSVIIFIQAIQWTCEAITASEYGAYITIKHVGSIQINKIDLCINKYIRLAIQF